MNSFTLTAVGNLARDPVLVAKGDTTYARFLLVGNDYAGYDEAGTREAVTSVWFVAFGSLGQVIARKGRKGDQLILQAHVRSNIWTDKRGETQYDHDRCEKSDRFIARHHGNRQSAHRHQRQSHQESLAPADMVDIGAEENRPQGTYHETDGKRRHREHQRREFAAGGKVGTADRGAEIAEDHEVVHFQEISAGHAENRSYLLPALFGCQHRVQL